MNIKTINQINREPFKSQGLEQIFIDIQQELFFAKGFSIKKSFLGTSTHFPSIRFEIPGKPEWKWENQELLLNEAIKKYNTSKEDIVSWEHEEAAHYYEFLICTRTRSSQKTETYTLWEIANRAQSKKVMKMFKLFLGMVPQIHSTGNLTIFTSPSGSVSIEPMSKIFSQFNDDKTIPPEVVKTVVDQYNLFLQFLKAMNFTTQSL